MKKHAIWVLILLLLGSAVVSGKENLDTSFYITGLEMLLDERPGDAGIQFRKLLEEFPRSPYAEKAEQYLLGNQFQADNSGIVTFYLGNLATAVYTAMMMPTILGYDLDAVMAGATGLVGVGTGLGGSWLMSREHPISSAADWWIESTQIVSLGNYFYLSSIIDFDELFGYSYGWKVQIGGQLLTLLGSRTGAYFKFRDNPPPKGQGSFMLHSYGWANAYYHLITRGVLELENDRAVNIGGMIASDLAALGSLYLWESLEWSPLRTGLVTVGGLGGGLIGFFSLMILSEFIDMDTPEVAASVTVSAISGQAAAVWFTRNMKPDRKRRDPDVLSGLYLFPMLQERAGTEGLSVTAGMKVKL